MDSEKLIQLFLSGQLDEAGQKQLADLVENDPELASQLEIESAFYTKRNLALKNNLRAKKKNYLNQKPASKPTKLIKLISSIAAALLICVVSYLVITDTEDGNTPKLLASEYLEQKHIAPVTLMGDNQNEKYWSATIEAYKQSDYDGVIENFKSIQDPTDEQVLYASISKLYLKDPNLEGAINDLKAVLSKPESLVEDQANWFLALAYLSSDDEASAMPILQSIEQSRSWNHENASQLLNSMK